ncbi:FMN-dependent NADH-azoreductase [Sphingomonas sinipercae]|uniref:FMN dependent NADH:quinone oxidoreductase n=1 Tax=Sphingomonas sinipercae TaxID=2714944 RepID=A0A6G7ZKC7_9SPHN|nr:NAD(P)H-dependent oxidoreductase [Sphingomonas sinipercae]QIL01431.1 FMN-dependent NADH-azoreductase [Sphingomonas sinipercae]
MTILHLDSSITGEASVSRQLSASVVERLKRERPVARVVRRDLFADPLSHLTLDAYADSNVLDEFLDADTVVIGAPMYNFTLPTQLKAWLDRILVAGRTFRYNADGPEGLAGGKRVIVAMARGGIYDDGSPAAALEHLETYLRGVFAFIGIAAEFVSADGLNISPEQKAQSVSEALGETVRLAA